LTVLSVFCCPPLLSCTTQDMHFVKTLLIIKVKWIICMTERLLILYYSVQFIWRGILVYIYLSVCIRFSKVSFALQENNWNLICGFELGDYRSRLSFFTLDCLHDLLLTELYPLMNYTNQFSWLPLHWMKIVSWDLIYMYMALSWDRYRSSLNFLCLTYFWLICCLGLCVAYNTPRMLVDITIHTSCTYNQNQSNSRSNVIVFLKVHRFAFYA
jgi:hypothetical protein